MNFFMDYSSSGEPDLNPDRDFWWWILAYRWKSRPVLLKAIADYAPNAKLQVFRDPEALNQIVVDAARESQS
jgi:hypothetical protein